MRFIRRIPPFHPTPRRLAVLAAAVAAVGLAVGLPLALASGGPPATTRVAHGDLAPGTTVAAVPAPLAVTPGLRPAVAAPAPAPAPVPVRGTGASAAAGPAALVPGRVVGTTATTRLPPVATTRPATTTSTAPPPAMAWRAQAVPTGTAALDAVTCADTTHCWAAGYSGVLATADGGVTWTAQTVPALTANDYVAGISCVDRSACWAATHAGRLLRTTDGGATWAEQPGLSGTVAALTCSPGTTTAASADCWALAAPATVERTTDGGATWSTADVCANCTVHALSCPTATRCWAAGTDTGTGSATGSGPARSRPAVWASSDGGRTWTLQTAFGSDPAVAGQALSGISCSTTALCTAVGGTGWAASTIDGGSTWTTAATPAGAQAVACTPTGACWAGATSVMYRPSPGAQWAVQYSPPSATVAALDCSSSGECWAVGAAAGTGSGATSGSAAAPGRIYARTPV